MSYMKNCPACGREYETPRKNQIFCSGICANTGRAKNFHARDKVERHCLICLNSFWGEPHAKYCSEECSREAIRRREREEREKKKAAKGLTLSEVARLAREAGMSYGEYVAAEGI